MPLPKPNPILDLLDISPPTHISRDHVTPFRANR